MIAEQAPMAPPQAGAPPSARTPRRARPEWRPSRRQLLKTGLAGTFVLATAGTWAEWTAGTAFAKSGQPFLRAEYQPLARAVIQAFCGWAMPPDAAARKAAVDEAVRTADAYFASFSPAVQEEAQQAFDLLNIGLVRWLIAGVSDPWETAKPEQVNAMLEGFRTSRFATKRQIFQLLEGVATVGWFGQKASWAGIGYGGPPQFPRPTGEKPL